MKMQSALCALSLSVSAFANAQKAPTTCEDVGATTSVKQPALQLGVVVKIGEPQTFCDFNDDGRHAIILATTLLSTTPSLAATAYRTGPMPVLAGGAERSDTKYCESLGGTFAFGKFKGATGWMNEQDDGASGMCVFADGSIISTWTLFYKRRGVEGRPDFEAFFQNPIIPVKLW